MEKSFRKRLLEALGAKELFEIAKIQDLWSGYGTIKRYGLHDSEVSSIVVKEVCFPEKQKHPRGWNSNQSHNRKLKSYQVESHWYSHWREHCPDTLLLT